MIHMTLGHNRFLWNRMLQDKQAYYASNQTHLYTRPAQYKDTYPFLKDIDSLSLANTQLALEKAFKAFYAKKSQIPKFHSKKQDYGYTTNLVNNNIELADGYLKLPKLGKIKLKQHREIPSHMTLKHVTVSKTPTGKYFASINYAYIAYQPSVEVKETLGLDFSLTHFYVDDLGFKIEYPQTIQMDFQKLKILQRSLSRRTKNGSNYKKKQKEIAILYEKIKHRRDDFLHKLSNTIAKGYDSVTVEKLELDLIQIAQANKHFAKQIQRFGWQRFITCLKYKLEDQGKRFIQLSQWYPSSKTCSRCGEVKSELKITDRVYECQYCHYAIDRDINAAINIKRQGLIILGFA
jgi:putative transposase